jgi:hypothetical protein
MFIMIIIWVWDKWLSREVLEENAEVLYKVFIASNWNDTSLLVAFHWLELCSDIWEGEREVERMKIGKESENHSTIVCMTQETLSMLFVILFILGWQHFSKMHCQTGTNDDEKSDTTGVALSGHYFMTNFCNSSCHTGLSLYSRILPSVV